MGGPFDLDSLLAVCPHGVTEDAFRRQLLVSTAQWRRYRAHGLSADSADRKAVQLKMHPAEIWANWVDAALEVEGAS